jgi:hypothetical protein
MDERLLYDRVHQALDAEPSPGAYDRLRVSLTKSPARPHRGLSFTFRWPKMGLRLAAVVTLVVLGIALVAGFVATHRVAENITQVNSDHATAAYKLMVSDAYAKVSTEASNWNCNSGTEFVACEADGNRLLPAGYQWLNDLNRIQPPATFAVAHAQLRLHVTAQIARTYALIAASRAHDAAAVDREVAVIRGHTGSAWVQTMVESIVASKQRTAPIYVSSVRTEKQGLDGCVSCQDLAGQSQYSCAGGQATSCQDLVKLTATQVLSFQAALVRTAAPNSLTAKDSRLQLDLANAAAALVTMDDALSAGDQAAFNAGRTSLQQAMPAISRDAADILKS